MGASKAGANLPHIKRLVAAFGAKAMIDGRGLDATGKGGVGEEEQGEAVGTAGHGDAEAFRLATVEVFDATSEAGNGFRGRSDRKSGVKGKSVEVRVDLGGGRTIKKKKNT